VFTPVNMRAGDGAVSGLWSCVAVGPARDGALRHLTFGPYASAGGGLAGPTLDRMMTTLERADCCVARPGYRVVLPATGTRTRTVQLLLCRHHLRRSVQELGRQGASVYDADDQPIDIAIADYCDS
jgi:hypothetical protein